MALRQGMVVGVVGGGGVSQIEYGIDVSSSQPRDLTAIIAKHKPSHVIVKGYLTAENVSQDHTREQVRSAQAAGCSVGMYAWCYRGVDPARTIDDIIALCASIDLALPLLWLDCEIYEDDPGPDAAWLRKALAKAAEYEMPCGIYTGGWWVKDYFPGSFNAFEEFSHLPMWLSQYDQNPDIGVFTSFSGIEKLAAKQWTTKLPGDTYELDRDVIWSDYTTTATTPQPTHGHSDAEIIEGLRIALDDVAYKRLGNNIEGLRITATTAQDVADALKADLMEMEATRAEIRRIRTQYLGE